jgi:multiple sugar transport system permease protein
VASLIWKMSIFNGLPGGMANTVLRLLGQAPRQWLSRPHPPLYWVVIVTERLWLQVGFYMVLFLAGLQRIPKDLYEAAAVDGATPGWQTLRFITMPQLRATSAAVLVLLLINAFQAFDEFYNLLSNPGAATYPPYARPPLIYLYYIALGRQQDFGHGSAGAVLLTLIIAFFTLAQGKLLGFGKRGSYG